MIEADPDDPDYVRFGDVARQRCGMQCQYCARYLDGSLKAPNLGEGLRWKGDVTRYHGLVLHRDDVDEFVRRVRAFREPLGCWSGESA